MNTDIQNNFMSYAITLALKGQGKTSPNPMVGCVIVKNGRIIGEGYHEKYGEHHAEVNAFKNCSETPEGSDLYVTLEPCSIHGKTPPCVDRIIENGIKNVFIGTKDINPDINGDGVEKLKNAHINVFDGILEKECYDLNVGFFKWIKTGMPWVIIKIAQSNNGFMGIDSNSSIWITGDDTKINTHSLRSSVDGIMVGRKTAEVDNPKLTVRRVSGINPIRIIADTHRKLPLDLGIFNDNSADNIVLCSNETFKESQTSFCKYIPVKEIDGYLDPNDILISLGSNGITKLLIEGGKDLIASFLDKNLADEVYLYTSNDDLEDAKLENPFVIDNHWEVINEQHFINDTLKIVRKKELCLQES
jgi:diaminohydroxyphosphoribosylaminopyrimidine deaminase/5-amino-6-(5-phosphoribosylamino)uracil reductase